MEKVVPIRKMAKDGRSGFYGGRAPVEVLDRLGFQVTQRAIERVPPPCLPDLCWNRVVNQLEHMVSDLRGKFSRELFSFGDYELGTY